MREILFRGKRTDNGEWIEGFYAQYDRKSYIYTGEKEGILFPVYMEKEVKYEVDSETVCQYTGMIDDNGRKIFERDIVRAKISINDFIKDSIKNEENIYVVSYHNDYCYFYLKKKNNNLLFDKNWEYALKEIEVVGNIFDNPELVKE